MCKDGKGEKNDAATLRYMTPEMVADHLSTASPAMDVWAIGVMLYSILFYKFPFNGKSKREIKDAILNKEAFIPRDCYCTPEAKDLLNGCLQKDPLKRMTIL
jgi:serine/threonine protein kinase